MFSVSYRGVRVPSAYRVDMLVEDMILVENKTVQALLPVHNAQMLTYLKLSGRKLESLINGNVPLIKDGIVRLVNGLFGSSRPLRPLRGCVECCLPYLNPHPNSP